MTPASTGVAQPSDAANPNGTNAQNRYAARCDISVQAKGSGVDRIRSHAARMPPMAETWA